MKRLLFVIPVLLFAVLAAVFYDRLIYGSPNAPLPSPLVGKPVPEFQALAFDEHTEVFTREELAKGRPTIVNFWASWCAPCVLEAPVLKKLAERPDIALYGVVHKDESAKARNFLAQVGNPFTKLNNDPQGRVSIAWGVTGIPETFVVDGKGIIRAHFAGELTDRVVRDYILPALKPAAQ